MRIAIAALMRQTDPSLASVAMMETFTLRRDRDLLTDTGEVGGFVSVLRQAGADIVPLIAADGGTGGPIMRETFHVLAVELVHRLAARRPVDGVLLALHGATQVEDEPDAAAELLERVRNVLPPGTPIGVSLRVADAVTPRMRQNGVSFVAASPAASASNLEAGERTARLLLDRLLRGSASVPPILAHKDPLAASIFAPAALLREARRQKSLPDEKVPEVCILDPDGDLVRALRRSGKARSFGAWPCYHTTLDTFTLAERTIGILGSVVGAPFAVLVAEELFASGCRLLISLTSAGRIAPVGEPPFFVIIERALRDEGTSYHYATAAAFAEADPALVVAASEALTSAGLHALVGASWTTDAPFRETAAAIEAARAQGILAVEMEAAALYAFARARGVALLCLAHITNLMGQAGQDFEKGADDGTTDALRVLAAILGGLGPLIANRGIR